MSSDANISENRADRERKKSRRTIVLVHGGWCGGWLWRDVAPALRRRGLVVTTPTLSGLGERRHLREGVSLSTHIEDIVAHMEMEDLRDVTLVGQSYGGMVTTGVLTRIPDRIHSVIYLDAFVPEDGDSFIDLLAPALRSSFIGFRDQREDVPPLSLEYLGITDPALVDFMQPRLVNQPWATLFEPVKVSPRPAHVRVAYIRCSMNRAEHFDRIAARLARDPAVRMAAINATHICMLTAPRATVDALASLEDLQD